MKESSVIHAAYWNSIGKYIIDLQLFLAETK